MTVQRVPMSSSTLTEIIDHDGHDVITIKEALDVSQDGRVSHDESAVVEIQEDKDGKVEKSELVDLNQDGSVSSSEDQILDIDGNGSFSTQIFLSPVLDRDRENEDQMLYLDDNFSFVRQEILPAPVRDRDRDVKLARLPRSVIIAAVSMLSTSYNLSVISIVQVIIENQYCGGPSGCKDDVDLAATACLVGAIFGQLTFGYIGDCLGRSRALQLTMAISIFGALISAFAVPLDSSSPKTVFHFLAITRFVLGVGVGGVYPLSATIASESAGSSTSRGRTASIVFSMQGVANLLVPIIALALVQLPNGNGNPDSPDDLGLSWRLMLGLGGIPGILLAPYKAAETREAAKAAATDGAVVVVREFSPENELGIMPGLAECGAAGGAAADAAAGAADAAAGAANLSKLVGGDPDGVSDGSSTARMAGAPQKMTLMQALASPRYWGKILGCAGGWFLFDITFYGNQLFQAPVLASIFNVAHNKSAPSHFEPIEGDLSHNRALQMIMIACIALPGYYVSVCFMDSLGRRNIQLQGFFFMTVLFGILGIWFDEMQKRNLAALLLVLYGLTFFFSNFGPNSTTFILPSETFPPEVRTTLNGFSAASGKAGAALGSYFFMPFNRLYGLPNTMLACAAVTLAGLFLTLAFVEDVRRKSGNDVPIRATPAKVTKVSRRRTNSREILIPPRKPLRGRTNSREIFFPPRQPDGLRV